ncbi:MAG: transposase [Nitrospirae bacterium]|nr:transposase [Nitrospirota bacterium]
MRRGSLTLWFDEEAIKGWNRVEKSGKRGAPGSYGNIAILCALTLRELFCLGSA